MGCVQSPKLPNIFLLHNLSVYNLCNLCTITNNELLLEPNYQISYLVAQSRILQILNTPHDHLPHGFTEPFSLLNLVPFSTRSITKNDQALDYNYQISYLLHNHILQIFYTHHDHHCNHMVSLNHFHC